MIHSKKSSGKLILTAAVLFAALLFVCAPAAGASSGDKTQISELTLSLYQLTVTADSGISFAIDGQQVTSIPVIKDGEAVITVTSLPAGRTLKASVTGNAKIVVQRAAVTVQNVLSNATVTLSATKPSPSPSSGSASTWVQPQEDILVVTTTDVTRLYSGQPFFAATAVNLAEIQSTYPLYADELAVKFAAAETAGYKLVNSRGAPALAVLEHPDEKVVKETFCKVYEVTPVYAGAKIEKVEITVPMTDITASGLPYQDVNIYHGVKLPGVAGAGVVDLWIPLEILNITFDEKNYYFTAATDGVSPFGVLIKHFEPAESDAGEIPTPVPKTAVPLAGLLAGLGAAGVLLGLKRK